MVSGSNEQRSRRPGEENQDLCQVKEVVERRHQRKKKDGREKEKETSELRGGCLGESRAAEFDPAVQEKDVGRLPAQPQGSRGEESSAIREPPPWRSAHTRVTEQAVERALFSHPVKKAPGPDKLSFGAIRLLWKWDKERIVRLTRAAIRPGRHPAVWKRASGVVIRKPGKDDYTKLKAYRSISLHSCMVNVVEKVAAELLSEEAERRGLLSDGDFGSRK